MTDRKQALTDLLEKVEAGEVLTDTAYIGEINYESQLYMIAAYNGSLDAAKALHEAVLSGWHYSIDGRADSGCEAEVYTPPEPASKPWHCASVIKHQHDVVLNSDNPARAWLIAILKALIAQENNDD